MNKTHSQLANFPNRYWNATLSNLKIPKEYHKQIDDWLKDPKFFLILMGTPGTGKTHLCSAILNDKWGGKDVRYFRDDDLYLEAKKAISRGWDGCETILEKCDAKYLIIDDLGVDDVTTYKLQCTERMIDYRYSRAETAATIITTNLSITQVRERYSIRISSRLFGEENTLITMEGYDLRTEK